MLPKRASLQLAAALAAPPNTLLGCRFIREPEDATWHYSLWANSMSQRDLWLQQYRECPIAQPTWFYHRSVWERAGAPHGSSAHRTCSRLAMHGRLRDAQSLIIARARSLSAHMSM
jgi:hypothetical protein